MFWFWFYSFLFIYFCLVFICFVLFCFSSFGFSLVWFVWFGLVWFGLLWFALVASEVSFFNNLVEELCPLRFVPVREIAYRYTGIFYHIGIISVFTNRYAALLLIRHPNSVISVVFVILTVNCIITDGLNMAIFVTSDSKPSGIDVLAFDFLIFCFYGKVLRATLSMNALFIFNQFDWKCCNRSQGMCVSVCLSVCVCHLYNPNGWTNFDETFHKSPKIFCFYKFFSDFEN